jgi:hypothetical protein
MTVVSSGSSSNSGGKGIEYLPYYDIYLASWLLCWFFHAPESIASRGMVRRGEESVSSSELLPDITYRIGLGKT